MNIYHRRRVYRSLPVLHGGGLLLHVRACHVTYDVASNYARTRTRLENYRAVITTHNVLSFLACVQHAILSRLIIARPREREGKFQRAPTILSKRKHAPTVSQTGYNGVSRNKRCSARVLRSFSFFFSSSSSKIQ